MTSDARNGQGCRWERRDPPAGHGRRWLAEIGRFGLSPPAAQRDADRPGAFRRELQSAGGGHGEAGDFADDGAKPTMPQPFFHACEKRLVVASFNIDDAIGRQARLGDCGSEQVRSRDAPEDLTLGAGSDAGAEQRGNGAIDRAVAAASDFMQRAASKAPAGES